MRRVALGTSFLLAVLLAACPGAPAVDPERTQTEPGGGGGGNGGDGLTVDEFILAAEAICIESERAIEEAILDFGEVVDAEADAELLDLTIPPREEEVEALADLDVPGDLSEDFNAYVEARRGHIETLRERQAAGEAGNVEENLELIDQSLLERREANEIAADIGLVTCAQRLPEEDIAELEEITGLVFTSEDPEVCTEYLTPAVVEQLGGLEACEERQATDTGVESVDVSVLLGITGIHATVRVVPHGGPDDEVPLEVDFVYRGGTWKVHGIFPAVD